MGSIQTEDRLLTNVVDKLARDNPDSLYCIHEVQEGGLSWQKVTYDILANAIDRVAWWIDEKISGKQKGKVLAYIGANDLRYAVFILACMKTGNKALLLSTRNSQAASKHLLQETECSDIVDATEKPLMRQMIDELETSCADFSLRRWKIGSILEIFSPDASPPYLQKGTFAELEDSPVLIIHSSGTTGNPKPVILSHGYIATFDRMRKLPVPPGRQSSHLFVRSQGELRFMYGPLFHFVGIACIFECIFYQTPFLLAPDRPMTSSLFAEIMDREDHPTWGMVTPSLMEDMCATEEGQKALAKMSALNYGGAPVARATGEKVSSLLNLQTMLASSETGYTPTLLCKDPADWNYMEFNPEFEHRMEEVDDELWELVLPRPSSRYHHAIFYSNPQSMEYRTGDLFRRHPSKAALWQYECRGDDVIVLSNGEKFNPTQAEKQIQAHPLVKYAAVFGQGRFQPALLVEPAWEMLEETWSPDEFKKDLLGVVNEANAFLPAYGKIFESHIAFASPGKPFSLSPKATLRRRIIGKEYQDVINKLYDSEGPAQVDGIPNGVANDESPGDLDGSTIDEIQQWIQSKVGSLLQYDAVGLDDDLFVVGMDSLQAVRLSQILQNGIESQKKSQSVPRWTNTMLYSLPTIRKLAQVVHKQLHDEGESVISAEATTSWSREEVLSKTIWQQAQYLDSRGLTVAITGTTGEFGTYMLNSMLKDPSIRRIYCLNRTKDAAARQLLSFQKKGLSTIWFAETSRVQFLHVDLESEYLGLDMSDYNTIKKVNDFIHNAWPVNFNKPLSSFEPQLLGLRHILKLMHRAGRNFTFHFISSVSTVTGPSKHSGTSIQEVMDRKMHPLPYGYAESKFVAEALCDVAAKRRGCRVHIYRVGQLGGPSSPKYGMWNSNDWFPSLIRTSQTMKMLPNSLGPLRVDWLPIDIAAKVFKEIFDPHRPADPYRPVRVGRRISRSRSRSRSRSGSSRSFSPPLPVYDYFGRNRKVYHICNRHETGWMKLVPTIAKACNARVVTLDKWVAGLESLAANSALHQNDLNGLPALALLDFFRMLAVGQNQPSRSLETRASQAASWTLRDLDPVDTNLMETWLKQLKSWIPDLNV